MGWKEVWGGLMYIVGELWVVRNGGVWCDVRVVLHDVDAMQ